MISLLLTTILTVGLPLEDKIPQGHHHYFKVFAIDDEGTKWVVSELTTDGKIKDQKPKTLKLDTNTVIQVVNKEEGKNPHTTPETIRRWYLAGRTLIAVATWTKEDDINAPPNHILVAISEKGEEAWPDLK